ncbi:hypothetical protein CALCODRAFT_482883 [Calocera cornea HHB12733]|uniref:NADH-ubiquinone oxidoreductase B12 subunit n=1 Tax=Calocera cornea HHB12733 TaxID=1353952 RepID=A0A165G859_9BASI|nr:hypothetical protein CALCODRAFT_482883 [Calocera cornea HHB12733]
MGPADASPLHVRLRPTIVVVMADHPLYRDPWAKREAWRKHPIFSKSYFLRNMFPGFGIAVVAFSVYVIYDEIRQPRTIKKAEHH